jgi:glycerol-3-phosphate O-acyltransferase
MITAQKKLYNANYGLFGTIKNALFTPENNFGDIYVKHLEPINLSNYLSEKIGQSLVTQENFESAALQLSQELMLIQQKNTPTTLNALLSALLLQEHGDTMPMSKLLEKARRGFEYFKVKQIHTYMQVPPNQVLTEKHVESLGFELRNKGSKNCEIVKVMHAKSDLMQELILSFYAMPLSGLYIPEGCMALFLLNPSNAINGQFSVKELYEV